MILFKSASYWEKESFLSHVDYLIIGSGIVGLSTAIHLKLKAPNKKVLVLERGYLPSGASTKNAGFACIGSASELLDDLNHNSSEVVVGTLHKRWKGLLYLRELLGDKPMEFLKLGSNELFTAQEKGAFENCVEKLDWLNAELEQITNQPNVYQINNRVIKESNFSGFKYAISNKAEGQLNTGKMMQLLIQKAHSLGVIILNNINVEKVDKKEVYTKLGKISFKKLGICNNGFASQFLKDEDVRAVRAQIIVTSPISNLSVNGIFHFDKGYYYFRNIGNRVLLGGGRNLAFKAEETDEQNTSDQIINHLSFLLETKVLPKKGFTIDHQWAGTMGVGEKKEPIVKKINETHYCAVRLGGMGVAIGSLVGKELSELMLQ